jgi:hypothetical protein
MKNKIKRFFSTGKNFKPEFRRQLRLLITFTFGFTIAFTWRQTIFDISQTFVKFMTNIQDSVLSSIMTSTFITLISIILIYFSAIFLKNNGTESY